MEYPKEIYQVFSDDMSGSGRRNAYNIGCARGYQSGYEAGKAEQFDYIESMSSLESVLIDVEQLEGEDLPFVKSLIERTVQAVRAEQADPSTHYSNLTSAIRDNDPIDWERLDGKKVKCVHSVWGARHGTLERDPDCLPDVCGAWWDMGMDDTYISALVDAWHGIKGWTLYVEGEVPLRRKTADELEVGRFFTGKLSCTVRENLMCVADEYGRGKHVRFAADFSPSRYPATEWVVIEEHGTFQKPEGK